jgi:hypothetical protein
MTVFLKAFIEDHYKKNETKDDQLTFKKFMESYYNTDYELDDDYGISGINFSLSEFNAKKGLITSGVFSLKIEHFTKKAADILKFLDDSAEDIENIMYLIAAYTFEKMDKKAYNIYKIYGKYLPYLGSLS